MRPRRLARALRHMCHMGHARGHVGHAGGHVGHAGGHVRHAVRRRRDDVLLERGVLRVDRLQLDAVRQLDLFDGFRVFLLLRPFW